MANVATAKVPVHRMAMAAAAGGEAEALLLEEHHRVLDRIEAEVTTRNDLASGHANYLPGAACVISTTAEQTPADIINYARACAKAHETWLEEQP